MDVEQKEPSKAIADIVRDAFASKYGNELEEIEQAEGFDIEDFLNRAKIKGINVIVSFQSIIFGESYADGSQQIQEETYNIYIKRAQGEVRKLVKELRQEFDKAENQSFTAIDGQTYSITFTTGDVQMIDKKSVFMIPVIVKFD